MWRWFQYVAVAIGAAIVVACGGGDDEPTMGNVVQQAQTQPRYATLVEALSAADLAGTLSGPGPYTIFAPTDDAFAAALSELGLTKQQLLADKALLTSVLTYHVVPGAVTRSNIPLGKAITTVQGAVFKVEAASSGLVVTDGRNRQARIVVADQAASNGVIHEVDKVLLPPNRTIVQTAQALPDFSILVEAVTAANLAGTLNAAGPLTVFAPTNAAFAKLLAEPGLTKEQLLGDTALLTKVLSYHVVSGRVLKADVPLGSPITTVQGQSFTVDSSLTITDQRSRTARITTTDVLASNGVIHVIDTVILPRP
jgi:uncharacterized surface protein with fasciclin (FAS1) repeats